MRARRSAALQTWLACHAVGTCLLLNCLLLPLLWRIQLPQPLHWILDLAVHWQWLYAALLTVLCLLGAPWRPKWLLLLPLCALPFFTASDRLPDAAPGTKAALRIAVANVHVTSKHPGALLRWLASEPVDVLGIVELSPQFAEALQRQAPPGLRHMSLHPLSTPWGTGLLSSRPLLDSKLVHAADGVARLEATLEIDGRPVRIVVVHPKPPMTESTQIARDALMKAVSRDAGSVPTVVVGDINATPWSRPLLDAAEDGLRRATTLAPTWRAGWRVLPGIPIDHILATPPLSVGTASRGPGIGSDHLPVRAELHWTSSPVSATDR